jgi:hypothetical protein
MINANNKVVISFNKENNENSNIISAMPLHEDGTYPKLGVRPED